MTVESRHRHDFKECGCDNQVMVDGGHAYLRGGAKHPELVESLCIVEEDGPTVEDGNDEWTTSDLFEEEKAS